MDCLAMFERMPEVARTAYSTSCGRDLSVELTEYKRYAVACSTVRTSGVKHPAGFSHIGEAMNEAEIIRGVFSQRLGQIPKAVREQVRFAGDHPR